MPFHFTSRPGERRQDDLFAPAPQKPTGDYLIAHVDGGARGNPGPAGFGVLIESKEGLKLAELSQYLGRQTNNFAEYSGLVAALEYTLAHNHRGLRVISDSELMVRQIKGIYKVRNENLRPLYERAKTLMRKLDYFEIGHVLRGKNKDADRLANEAMDRGR
ncbi:MAG: ribonuclease HI family protein [Acidobacteria bacterium]|nr:ribonuclease HI family protein [Acidobacteriota bacterium]